MADAGYPDAGPDNIAFTISYAGIGGLSFEEFFGTLLQENLLTLNKYQLRYLQLLLQ